MAYETRRIDHFHTLRQLCYVYIVTYIKQLVGLLRFELRIDGLKVRCDYHFTTIPFAFDTYEVFVSLLSFYFSFKKLVPKVGFEPTRFSF